MPSEPNTPWGRLKAMRYTPTTQSDVLQRILTYAEPRPQHIASGYSALTLYQLPYLVDTAPLTFIGPTRKTRAPTPTQPGVTRRGAERILVKEVCYPGQLILAASPVHATVQALQILRKGTYQPPAVVPDGFDPLLVRAVQLVDCVRRHLQVSPDALLEAARGRVDRPWLLKVLNLSSRFADSPRETELRLLLRTVTKAQRLKLSEQVPVYRRRRLVTTFDFAIEPLKIGIMYDGQHHWEYDQRQKDARINLDLALEGWTVVRFAAATFAEVVPRLEELLDR